MGKQTAIRIKPKLKLFFITIIFIIIVIIIITGTLPEEKTTFFMQLWVASPVFGAHFDGPSQGGVEIVVTLVVLIVHYTQQVHQLV